MLPVTALPHPDWLPSQGDNHIDNPAPRTYNSFLAAQHLTFDEGINHLWWHRADNLLLIIQVKGDTAAIDSTGRQIFREAFIFRTHCIEQRALL